MMSVYLSSALNVKREQLTNLLETLKGFQDGRVPQHGIKKITITRDADGDDDGTYEKYDINIQEPQSRRYPSPTWKPRPTKSAAKVESNKKDMLKTSEFTKLVAPGIRSSKEANFENYEEGRNTRISKNYRPLFQQRPSWISRITELLKKEAIATGLEEDSEWGIESVAAAAASTAAVLDNSTAALNSAASRITAQQAAKRNTEEALALLRRGARRDQQETDRGREAELEALLMQKVNGGNGQKTTEGLDKINNPAYPEKSKVNDIMSFVQARQAAENGDVNKVFKENEKKNADEQRGIVRKLMKSILLKQNANYASQGIRSKQRDNGLMEEVINLIKNPTVGASAREVVTKVMQQFAKFFETFFKNVHNMSI